MTIIEAINNIDALKPNAYTQTDKIRWLSRLDGKVKADIIDTHEGAENTAFNGYNEDDENFSIETELLIPAPYDDVYPLWLEAQIDYANNEYGRYNNSIAMFNATYSAFERWYNRNHMPLGTKIKLF